MTIEITQYGVARILKDKSHPKSLFTKNLNVCLGIILVSDDKIMLMHVDTNVDTDYIAEQIVWMGEKYSLYIAKNNRQLEMATSLNNLSSKFGVDQFLNRLKKSLEKSSKPIWSNKVEFYNASQGSVVVHSDGKIDVNKTPSSIEQMPEFSPRQMIDFLNYIAKCDGSEFAKLDLDVQYDVTTWTPMPILSKTAIKLAQLYVAVSNNWNQFLSVIKTDPSIHSDLIDLLTVQRFVIESHIIEATNYIPQTAKALLSKITPSKKWGVNLAKSIMWLEVATDEEADKIIKHFNKNGCTNIKKQYKQGTKIPIITITEIDLEKLNKMPVMGPFSGLYNQMFKPADNIFKNYLKCSQLGTVRLDDKKTPPNIEGLCTDGMSACIGIIIIGENGRISLTHTDLAVSEEAVMNECAWVGSPCRVYIVKGVNYKLMPGFEESSEFKTKTLPRLKKALGVEIDTETYKSLNGAIAVTRKGEVKQPGDMRVGRAVSNIEFRHCINMINAYALSTNRQYHALDIQYDSTQWTDLTKLTPEALKLVSNYKTGNRTHMGSLDNDIKGYLDYYEQYKKEAEENNSEGANFYKIPDYPKAIEYFEKAIQRMLFISEERSPDIIRMYSNLGLAKKNNGDPEGGKLDLTKAFELSSEVLGKEHKETQKIQERLNKFSNTYNH